MLQFFVSKKKSYLSTNDLFQTSRHQTCRQSHDGENHEKFFVAYIAFSSLVGAELR